MKGFTASSQKLHHSKFLRGAHHPHCQYHRNHLIWIGNRPFCLGCTSLYSGISIGIIASLTIHWHYVSFLLWLFICFFLLIPTVFQPKVQQRYFKIGARFLLGVSTAFFWVGGLLIQEYPFDRWIFIFLMTLTFYLVFRLFRYIRKTFTKSPCDSCPLGTYPFCSWNISNLTIDIRDSSLLEAISQNNIETIVQK